MTSPLKKTTSLFGIYPPTVTAFHPDGSLNEKGIREFVRFLLSQGVHGLTPLGSAGEFYAMTERERMRAMEWILDEVGGRVPVYAGTGHYSTATTIELSQHAKSCGASGLLIITPYLLRPPKRLVLEHFRRIHDAVGLPIMIYNVPVLTGIEISPEELKQLADEGVIHAVKWSHLEVSRVHDTRLLCGPDFPIFTGIDLIAFEALAVGADGYIGGLPMIVPGLTCQLYEKICVEGNLAEARALWYRLLPLVRFEYRALFSDSGEPHWLAVCREAAALRGIPVGPSRPPMQSLSEGHRRELQQILKELGEL